MCLHESSFDIPEACISFVSSALHTLLASSLCAVGLEEEEGGRKEIRGRGLGLDGTKVATR